MDNHYLEYQEKYELKRSTEMENMAKEKNSKAVISWHLLQQHAQ